MQGTINQYGTATLVWDTQAEILAAPPLEGNVEAKYLPCDQCGKPQVVRMNVVSIICGPCWEEGPVTGQCEECGKDVKGDKALCDDCYRPLGVVYA